MNTALVPRPFLQLSSDRRSSEKTGQERGRAFSASPRGSVERKPENVETDLYAVARSNAGVSAMEIYEAYSLKGKIRFEVTQSCGLLLDEYA